MSNRWTKGENKRQLENFQNKNLGILDGDLDAVLTFCYALSRFKEEKENAQPSTEQQVSLFMVLASPLLLFPYAG